MKNILIDTCSWIDLLSEDTNKLLPHLEFWKNNNCINIISHELIIEEWNKHKEKQKQRFSESLKTKYEHTREIVKKEKLSIPENLAPNIQNIENQISIIDELLNSSTILSTSDDIKIFCSDRTITKKAPFHHKLDSTKDAYIIFSALKYFSEQKQELLFISANKKEFGSPDNLELEIHPEITENYQDVNVRYFNDIGRAISMLKQELSIVMLAEDINNISAFEHGDEIIIDKTKPILDQIYDYINIRQKEISFCPVDIFINHYPFKLKSNSDTHYSAFCLSTDNYELFDLFRAIDISENNTITITNPSFYEGVKDYNIKIKEVLLGLSQNLIFNISNEKTREQINIRYSDGKNCGCPKCNLRKFKFVDCFNSIGTNTNKDENILESGYVHYHIGNFVFAANRLLRAEEQFKKNNQNISIFISQFNLSKLPIFILNNSFGEDSQDKLLDHLKKIDLAYKATNLSTKENSKVIELIKDNTFYSNSRDKIQSSTTKIVDQYYNHFSGGWSSNNDVWILINEYAKLESFLNDNYIVYDKFREFSDIFSIFVEGLFASYGIDDAHHSHLEIFDDWLIIQLLYYGNAEIINKYFIRYKLKNLKYKKTSFNGESLVELIENFFSNDGLRESFLENCEKGNRTFWEYYNTIFKNILTIVSICDFDESYYNLFTQKLVYFLETETLLHYQSYKYIDIYLYRCSKHIKETLLNRLFDLGLNKTFYHKSDYFETLADVTKSRNIRFDISESQFSVVKNLAFEECNICKEKHQDSIIIPIWQLINNTNYKEEIGDIITKTLQDKFRFNLFYLSTLFEIIPFNKRFEDKAIKLTHPNEKKISLRSIITGIDDNRFDSINAIINLCFKFDIDTCIDKYKPFKSLDKYYEWLIDMDNFDYSQFRSEWISEYPTRYYYRKIYNNKLVKEKLDEILQEKFDTKLERDYLNIYIRKTWNINH